MEKGNSNVYTTYIFNNITKIINKSFYVIIKILKYLYNITYITLYKIKPKKKILTIVKAVTVILINIGELDTSSLSSTSGSGGTSKPASPYFLQFHIDRIMCSQNEII